MVLYEACESSSLKKSMVLPKAACIIMHDIFQENVKFQGAFSRNKQNVSITFSMQQLRELILAGTMSNSVAPKEIASNFGQLLK